MRGTAVALNSFTGRSNTPLPPKEHASNTARKSNYG